MLIDLQRAAATGLLALGAAIAPAAGPAAEEAPADSHYVSLQVGITGSNDLKGLDDPVVVLRRAEVSRLMQDIADTPRDKAFIERALKDSDVDLKRLLKLGLLKKKGKTYAISFTYFALEDHDRLIEVLTPLAAALADEYEARWRQIAAVLERYDVDSVPRGALAFAIIGAFSLDWDGLTITGDGDYRTTADNLPQGQPFVVWARESASPESLKGIYWGSHNIVAKGVHITSFGDHADRPDGRLVLPDYLWRMSTVIALPKSERTPVSLAASNVADPYLEDLAGDAGLILLAMRDGARDRAATVAASGVDESRAELLLRFLEELGYIRSAGDGCALLVPVLTEKDRAMLRELRDISNSIILNWHKAHYDEVAQKLGDLTVIRNGVPYKHLYTQIWHYLFGLTNKALTERGYMIDPYTDGRIWQGYDAFVFLEEIYDEDVVVSR